MKIKIILLKLVFHKQKIEFNNALQEFVLLPITFRNKICCELLRQKLWLHNIEIRDEYDIYCIFHLDKLNMQSNIHGLETDIGISNQSWNSNQKENLQCKWT